MNKTQIINHIACRLESLLNDPSHSAIVGKIDRVNELSVILRDITRDDDYSFAPQINSSSTYPGSITATLNESSMMTGITALGGGERPMSSRY